MLHRRCVQQCLSPKAAGVTASEYRMPAATEIPMHNKRLASYYRALVMIAMRDAGHSLRSIAEYFLISHQRVAQILKRGARPAQLELPITQEQP